MARFTVRHVVETPNYTQDVSLNYTAGTGITLSETVVQNTTTVLLFGLDVSACKGFMMSCDRACTVNTNNGGSPVDTITLVANKPYVWTTDDYNAFLLGTDVVSLHVVLAAGDNATLRIEAIVDPTP